MIAGVVNARREAVLGLCVRGPGRTELVDAVVDTGFSGSLTLPTSLVAKLGLVRVSTSHAILADGSNCPFEVYEAEIEWGTGWRPILVSAVGTEVLAGMRLLANHEFRVAVIPGGVVAVTPLP